MKILTAQQIRELDRQAIEECGISCLSLMQKAGQGIADAVAEKIGDMTRFSFTNRDRVPNFFGPVGIVAGKGNNGGDGFSAALSLASRGIPSTIFSLYPQNQLSKDALHFYRKAKTHRAIRTLDASTPVLLRKHAASLAQCTVVVDAILGTGFQGKLSGIVREAVDLINAHRGTVVAVDIPSGLDATAGKADKAVMADLTVTLGFCKTGFLQGDAMNYVGSLRVVDIGIPGKLSDAVPSEFYLLDKNVVGAVLPRRKRISYKGTYGHLLIIGGSMGMTGAAILCARAALRSGSGLVTVACPASAQPIVAIGCPEAMTLALADNAALSTAKNALETGKYNAVVLGPGIGRSQDTQNMVIAILKQCDIPIVLDADALYAVAANKFDLRKARCRRLILTPHMGEFIRLTGKNSEYDKKDDNKLKWGLLSKYSAYYGVIVALKSHITAISNGNSGVFLNINGNPGMATAGMGDVLSGVIGSFLGQGLTPLDGATAGVYIHSLAGDMAAKKFGFYGLITSDVIDALPQAIMDLPLPRRST